MFIHLYTKYFVYIFIDTFYGIDNSQPFYLPKIYSQSAFNKLQIYLAIVAALLLSDAHFETVQIIGLIAVHAIMLNGTSPDKFARAHFTADDHNSTVTTADLDEI